jgi:3-methyladenine DNA glycosylase AlkD
MTSQEIIKKLKSLGSSKNVAGMARFGIVTKKIYGVAHPDIDRLARVIGKNHALAQKLWVSGIHDARILAGLIDSPEWVTQKQMDAWTRDFDSWAVCDSMCMHLFSKTGFAHKKVWQYVKSKEEYVRRTGFVLMATLAVHDKKSPDGAFLKFFPLMEKYATDERNFVKKAINWALRQIGKRNLSLNREAIKLAKEIYKIDSRSARWIAGGALRELESEEVQRRLKNKK